MKRHLIEFIYEQMTNDSDGDQKQAERLVRLYRDAGKVGQWHLDECMMCLCGWTMETLIHQLQLENSKTDGG